MLTCLLSGPATSRSPTLAMLQRAGVDLREQPETNVSHGLPNNDPDVGWITARADALGAVEKALAASDRWTLRMHWNTPVCRACNGHKLGEGGSTCLHCLGSGHSEREVPRADPMEEIRKLSERVDTLGKLVGRM
jgi:hypothetical protein